ncbi:bifunctional DNA primase/polymerase [Methylobacterium sp. CB376]|uniref:bifunctional DNA primase/polymerase n=1 Tax=unclassified Methylobacterium TaxID=2615210 RepID=UPI000152D0D9|nr:MULTISPECIES: bifunctional DNA primase/polymerase [Methylobacterium]WFT80299.1 bifunctional DNA primase/polymerase [Methylobacterium nodulans]
MKPPIEIAKDFIEREFNPVVVPYGTKKATGKAWQKRTITLENVGKYFSSAQSNVGIQMGPKSKGLTDVDLDYIEAVKAAPYLLPETDAIFGRESKPRSHYLYRTNLSETFQGKAEEFKDPAGGMLVELRIGGGGKGAMTVGPGSVHPGGEVIRWDRTGDPSSPGGDVLRRSTVGVAVAALLARHYPEAEADRTALARAVGALCRGAGLPQDGIDRLIGALSPTQPATGRWRPARAIAACPPRPGRRTSPTSCATGRPNPTSLPRRPRRSARRSPRRLSRG